MTTITVKNTSGLSDDQIRTVCPSAYGKTAHISRSEKYQFVPTIDILDMLREEEYVPVSATQTRSRSADNQPFTKHMIRMRHVGDMDGSSNGRAELGGVIPEIVLINSHNGTSSCKILSGIIRFICENGLIIGDNLMGSAIRHQGEGTMDEVIATANKVLENSKISIEGAKNWQRIKLEQSARYTIANLAANLRFGEHSMIQPSQLLEFRRPEDEGKDLWTTFNVIQENILRGGLVSGGVHNGRWKTSRTRDINAVDKVVELNQGLWNICSEFA